jgi:hypothetical protein
MREGAAVHRGCEDNRGIGCGQTARPGLHGGCRGTGMPTVEAANIAARVVKQITNLVMSIIP